MIRNLFGGSVVSNIILCPIQKGGFPDVKEQNLGHPTRVAFSQMIVRVDDISPWRTLLRLVVTIFQVNCPIFFLFQTV